MNYYSFHIGDYVTATVHLEPLEDLAYRRLLDMYYDTEQAIPLETHRVSRRLRLDTEIVDSVLKEFFTLTDGGWVNGRCDADIAAYHRKADANRSNGKQGGRPKKTHSVNFANPTETQNNLNQEPVTNNHKPVINHAPEKPARFDPLKISLPDCIERETWAEWIAYRRDRKLTTRQQTMQAQVDELATWAKSGHDPTSVIKTSIAKGWQGLFEPKQGNQNGNYSDFVAELTGRNRNDHAHVIDGQAERVG